MLSTPYCALFAPRFFSGRATAEHWPSPRRACLVEILYICGGVVAWIFAPCRSTTTTLAAHPHTFVASEAFLIQISRSLPFDRPRGTRPLLADLVRFSRVRLASLHRASLGRLSYRGRGGPVLLFFAFLLVLYSPSSPLLESLSDV